MEIDEADEIGRSSVSPVFISSPALQFGHLFGQQRLVTVQPPIQGEANPHGSSRVGHVQKEL